MGLYTLFTLNRSKPRVLRPATSYNSFSSQLALLPLRIAPPAPPISIEVPNSLLCPSPNCDVEGQHTWVPSHPILPCPPHMPVIDIKRFENSPNPRPTKNRYGLFTQPSFQIADGQWVYTPLHGVVNLQITDYASTHWLEFRLVEEWEGQRKHVATLLIRRDWCEESEVKGQGGDKFKLGSFLSGLCCC